MEAASEFQSLVYNFLKTNNLSTGLLEEFYFVKYNEYARFEFSSNKKYIFEDEWQRNAEIVKNNLLYSLGRSAKVFARKCELGKIERFTAKLFFEKYHTMGYARAKYHYALFYEGDIVAAAAFSREKNFKYGKSAEMVRFCNAGGFVVVGGLSKLVKYYLRTHHPADMVTYADGLHHSGTSFENAGFKREQQLPPMTFMVNTQTGKRIPIAHFSNLKDHDKYVELKLPGSIKFRLSN